MYRNAIATFIRHPTDRVNVGKPNCLVSHWKEASARRRNLWFFAVSMFGVGCKLPHVCLMWNIRTVTAQILQDLSPAWGGNGAFMTKVSGNLMRWIIYNKYGRVCSDLIHSSQLNGLAQKMGGRLGNSISVLLLPRHNSLEHSSPKV